MIHDLIPIRHSYWFRDIDVQDFTRSLELALRNASLILTNSLYTARDTERYSAEMCIKTEPVHVVRFGDSISNFGSRTLSANEMRPQLRALAGKRFALMVGSLDVRKNQRGLVNIWERLWESLGPDLPTLVLIGKKGTQYHLLFDRLAKLKRRVRSSIHVFEDVADDELEWCYDNALFTLLPSLAEGWGLPAAESLARGKLCLCSNLDAILEVAGDLAWYFDPHDEQMMFDTVLKAITQSEVRRLAEANIRTKFKPGKWTETAAQISRLLAH